MKKDIKSKTDSTTFNTTNQQLIEKQYISWSWRASNTAKSNLFINSNYFINLSENQQIWPTKSLHNGNSQPC